MPLTAMSTPTRHDLEYLALRKAEAGLQAYRSDTPTCSSR